MIELTPMPSVFATFRKLFPSNKALQPLTPNPFWRHPCFENGKHICILPVSFRTPQGELSVNALMNGVKFFASQTQED
jgi:hypothetical protein